MGAAIAYEKSGPIARIRFDDGKANAMSGPWFEALAQAFDRAEAEGAGAVLLCGRPGFFSGGLDLKLLPTLSPDGLRVLAETFARSVLRVFSSPLPTVAAIGGHAIAGGAVLGMACDLRFATAGAYRLQLNEVAIGIPMPSWMALVAASAVPSHRLNEVLLHARAFSPEEALALGIVSALGSGSEETENLAEAASGTLAGLNRAAYAESKRRLRGPLVERALERLAAEGA